MLLYEIVCECNWKQKCVEIWLIELVIAWLYFWSGFDLGTVYYSLMLKMVYIGIWRDKVIGSRMPCVSISWHLDTGHGLGVRKMFSRHPLLLLHVLCAFNLLPLSCGVGLFLLLLLFFFFLENFVKLPYISLYTPGF